jgi:hypothetical protein
LHCLLPTKLPGINWAQPLSVMARFVVPSPLYGHVATWYIRMRSYWSLWKSGFEYLKTICWPDMNVNSFYEVASMLVLVQQDYFRIVLYRLHIAKYSIRDKHGIQCCINFSADLVVLKKLKSERGTFSQKQKPKLRTLS